MSHFCAYVLVHKDSEDIQATVDELMAPYGAETDEEHDLPCWCVTRQAFHRALKLAEKRFGPLNEMIKEFNQTEGAKDWEEFSKERADFQEQEAWDFINREKPEPNLDCQYCNGTGVITFLGNPYPEWDLKEVGGRYEGIVRNSGNQGADPNILPVRELDLNKVPVPWAIVTPEGEWHGRARRGLTSDSCFLDVNWDHTVRGILRRHRETTLVVVDCHS